MALLELWQQPQFSLVSSWKDRQTFFGPFGSISTKVKRIHSLGDNQDEYIYSGGSFFLQVGAVQTHWLHLTMPSARKGQIRHRCLIQNRTGKKRLNSCMYVYICIYIYAYTHTNSKHLFFFFFSLLMINILAENIISCSFWVSVTFSSIQGTIWKLS